MEYQVNDIVVYGTDGICSIDEISRKKFHDNIVEYYVLKPVFNPNAKVFVPVKNEELIARMRYSLTEKEVKKIIKNMLVAESVWIVNENERKQRFKEIINSGDTNELSKLVKTLYLHKEEQKSIGKKMHITDEKFFKDAEKLLYEEFAVALDMSPAEVVEYISKKFSKANQK